MDEYPPLIREVFIVRLWREATGDTWRGQVVHVPDQETASFASWDQAADFIRRFGPELGSRQNQPGED